MKETYRGSYFKLRGLKSVVKEKTTISYLLNDIHFLYKNYILELSYSGNKSSLRVIDKTKVRGNNIVFSVLRWENMISQCGGAAFGNGSFFVNKDTIPEGLVFFSIRYMMCKNFSGVNLFQISGPKGCWMLRIIDEYNDFAKKVGCREFEEVYEWYNRNSGNKNSLMVLDIGNGDDEDLNYLSSKMIEVLESKVKE